MVRSGFYLKMSNEYPASAYTKLLEEFEIDLDLTDEQSVAWNSGQNFALSGEQMSSVIHQISRVLGSDTFLTEFISAIIPVRLSLFVFNDALWNLMMRKPWEDSREQMLAMSTIPLCAWKQDEEKTSNPKGVCRHDTWPNEARLELSPKKQLMITGRGGDFAGFIERSHRTARKWGMPESRKLIPNYEFVDLNIVADLEKAKISIRPPPRDDIDYDFSESAKFFFDNGIMISLPEGCVTLTSGKRKPAVMKGESVLLLGYYDSEEPYKNLLSSIWFWALATATEEH
jgi:hypothetical protein